MTTKSKALETAISRACTKIGNFDFRLKQIYSLGLYNARGEIKKAKAKAKAEVEEKD